MALWALAWQAQYICVCVCVSEAMGMEGLLCERNQKGMGL